MDALERAVRLLARYEAIVQDELPAGADIVDAHTHIGTDIDGMVADRDDLLDVQRRTGISRSFVFCLDEPDREPGFSAANDRTLAHAEAASGELVPFVRLDLQASPVEEAVRCIDRGARGIKLHPRAQRFLPSDARLEPVFELAADRGVPILIHGGRGLPPIADDLGRLHERYGATLIIAHAGIVDMEAMARNFAGRAGVFFDTSTFSVLDLLDLFRLVPAEQVLYASDYPYGTQPQSLLSTLRAARISGLDEETLRGILGGYANRIADGGAPVAPTVPRGVAEFTIAVTLSRIHQYLTMSTMMLWLRQPTDSYGILGLALNACEERTDGHRETTDRIRELLRAAMAAWEVAADAGSGADLKTWRLPGRLVHLASTLALTDG
jgi:predicted TIM-barrel fold metal-dependent hydrolase